MCWMVIYFGSFFSFEVYCPNDKTLLSGIMDEDGESWAPVINGVNEWVQVGTGGECDLYSNRYGRQPEWGIEGGVEKGEVSPTLHSACSYSVLSQLLSKQRGTLCAVSPHQLLLEMFLRMPLQDRPLLPPQRRVTLRQSLKLHSTR